MVRLKDGFMGERAIVLSPMVVEMEENDPIVSSLYVTDIGYYPHATHHYRDRSHAINQYVLIYCIDGSGWYRIGHREYKVGRNQYFILPAGIPHTYGADPSGSWTIYWIHFRGEHASYFAEGAQEPQEINVNMNSRILERNNMFEEIMSTLAAGHDLERLRYASSLLHHYLASMRYLKLFRSSVQRSDDASMVDAAIHFMQENLEKRITLQDIVRFVGYSPSHLSVIFKRQTGHSPLNYFNEMKIERACHLLETTDMKINQISYKVGIDDSLYFSRLFSKVKGISPSAYRLVHAKK